MVHISINLLPPEFAAERAKKAKFYRIQTIGVMIILTMIFLASLTVALRILQSHNITQVQARLSSAQQQVTDLQGTQTSLLLVKNRLTAINQILNSPSKDVVIYKLIEKLVPPSVTITGITIGKTGETRFIALVPDSEILDNLVSSLTSKQTNEDKIVQLSIDTLNRTKEGSYNISFKVQAK